jgi:MraZ protein
MLGFVGRYQHTLDAKGRLILPAKFRAEFEEGGLLSPNLDGCIALWTLGEFSRQIQDRLRQSNSGAGERQLSRYWSTYSTDVDFDKQGRFALPATSIEYAELEGEVLIVGSLDHIELWNPAIFDEKVNPAAEIFKQGNN